MFGLFKNMNRFKLALKNFNMEFWLSILRVSVGKKVLGFFGSYSDYDLTRNKIAMVFNGRFSKA